MNNDLRNLETILVVKTINGTSFVSVRNYRNKQGELSNQTFLVGANIRKMIEADLETLRAFDLNTLTSQFDLPTLNDAMSELIASNEKRLLSDEEKAVLLANNDSTIKRSVAMNEAFLHICKGIKAKMTDIKTILDLYIDGVCIRKTVIEKGVYKEVKSSQKTLAKRAIEKAANLKMSKYKSFMVGSSENLKLQGVSI